MVFGETVVDVYYGIGGFAIDFLIFLFILWWMGFVLLEGFFKNRYGKIFYGLISIVISCVLLYGEVAIGVTLFGSFKEFGLIILVFLAIMIIFLVSRRWFMPDEE